MKEKLILLSLVLLIAVGVGAQQTHYTKTKSDTWVSRDALDRRIENGKSYPARRTDKTVGIFYFVWQGAHGYDRHGGGRPDEGVMVATEADTISPYDISEMLRENPTNPQYGPVHAFHYWAQPHMGYYQPNDEWIIRKHAQMISDAGIDVMIIDVTNSAIYLPQILKICEVFTQIRKEGNTTPQISFIINSNPKQTLDRLFNAFYKKGLYSDLWFQWKGKPLMLCPPEGMTPETKAFFSDRHAWFASTWEWFGDGKDKWTWADLYPQNAGWHESKDIPESISVCAATHPMSNIGRSFTNGKQPKPENFRSGEGLYFADQCKRALEVDPEFVFITGWNEWVAMRFIDGASTGMIGKTIAKGETYFVDQYNEEYSRDIEPMKGGFGDNYYYQMVDFVRKYKGVEQDKVYTTQPAISVDGKMSDWEAVASVYTDDSGDVVKRNHPGWGRIRNYSNATGRNDIVMSKVSSDGKNLSFYVKTAAALTPYTDKDWMRLFIEVKNGSVKGWEGFQYVVNRQVKSRTQTLLEKSTGGWNWEAVRSVKYAVKGDEMEITVPLSALGITGDEFVVDFKWIDNAAGSGDILECIDNGDTAPNGRFRYRFSFVPSDK